MEDLTGKVAIVTGASKGMGRHFVHRLVSKGVKVAAFARASAELDSLGRELGGDVLTIACDVTDSASVTEAVDRAAAHFERIDILVNNAAIYIPFPFEKGSDAVMRSHVDVNILGLAWATRAAIPHLRKTQGQIVNISSESVRLPFPMLALYAGTKAAVETMSAGLRDELRSDGIRVGVLRSGNVSGGSGGQSWSEEATKQFYAKIVETGHAAMTGQPATPESMAEALAAMLALPRDVSIDLVELRAAQAGMPEGARKIDQ